MESFYVYILFSVELNRFYIGSANEIEGCLERHLQSIKGCTAKVKDWELKYSEVFDALSDAVRRELQIKKWKSRVMIEKLIGI